ncbi:MAG: hypothetical protein HRU26_11350 [Psychroserpens sp.]|nr:hypothetical protein [Psychroserpens sp.]
MENSIIKNYNRNKKKAESLRERWVKGDRVRVLKTLSINVCHVPEYLGEVCIVQETVKHIPLFGAEPRIAYKLRLGNRVETFWEDELDARFKSIAS